jgi:hypothetical protein
MELKAPMVGLSPTWPPPGYATIFRCLQNFANFIYFSTGYFFRRQKFLAINMLTAEPPQDQAASSNSFLR